MCLAATQRPFIEARIDLAESPRHLLNRIPPYLFLSLALVSVQGCESSQFSAAESDIAKSDLASDPSAFSADDWNSEVVVFRHCSKALFDLRTALQSCTEGAAGQDERALLPLRLSVQILLDVFKLAQESVPTEEASWGAVPSYRDLGIAGLEYKFAQRLIDYGDEASKTLNAHSCGRRERVSAESCLSKNLAARKEQVLLVAGLLRWLALAVSALDTPDTKERQGGLKDLWPIDKRESLSASLEGLAKLLESLSSSARNESS